MIKRRMGWASAGIVAGLLAGTGVALPGVAAAGVVATPGAVSAGGAVPHFSHVVIVMMENKNYNSIIGRPDEAPYLNDTLAKGGAVFSNSFAVGHPSQPNYLAMFSGSTQGVTSDSCPKNFKNVPNLASELTAARLGFTGYSESMPRPGYTGSCSEISLSYTRVHNPWVDFSNVPASANLQFTSFPKSDLGSLPPVSFVIPNLCNDMHYCSRDTGDAWIKRNLGTYAQWARSNNSLLIVTWDEDGTTFGIGGDGNKVPTIFYGANVRPGLYSEHITHYSVLRTVEDMFGLPHLGQSAKAAPITDVWAN